MDRRTFSLSLLSAAVLAGCGGGSVQEPLAPPAPAPAPGPGPVPGPETPSALPVRTVFARMNTPVDTDGFHSPLQSGTFELDTDFSIWDGGDDQLDGAFGLSVRIGDDTHVFEHDQTYAELQAFGPELGPDDGVLHAYVHDGAAWLPVGPDVRLQQTVDLRAAAGHALELTWSGTPSVGYEGFEVPFFLQVVVRDAAGELLATLYRLDEAGETGQWGAAALDAYAGQVITLAFEQVSSDMNATRIDAVSLVDLDTSTEYIANGDFSTAAGWTMPARPVVQNIASGEREVPGLGKVQRRFYTQPNVQWARMTDVFTNTGDAPVNATIVYDSNLGSDGAGIIYETPGTNGQALTTWDGNARDRDVAFVFGSARDVEYRSTDQLETYNGDDNLRWSFDVTVPAGGSVTVVNFVVMTGVDTGQVAADTSARAEEADTIAADIVDHFRTDPLLRRGMTQAQLDTLVNF